MDPVTLDQVRLNFNPAGIAIINVAIGLMMLGVALLLFLFLFTSHKLNRMEGGVLLIGYAVYVGASYTLISS